MVFELYDGSHIFAYTDQCPSASLYVCICTYISFMITEL